MKIKIICVGKIKEKYFADGIKEYEKRLSRFCKFEICEVADEKIPDNASEKEALAVLDSEGAKIEKHIGKGDYIIALCVEGKNISSADLAKKFSEIQLSGKSGITFIIGGSLGICGRVKNMSDFRLSFSKMTFPHQLMRLILTEQIYRAFKINANEEYHK
ncbi:23S rRNA (pseudouridine(1915)-N(3))-methyltransferase RlmH [Qingrenia yutianensis]|uniref:Ribosomal RNA large subunit methyltransferase H n=1 Tax=Qingrenia yutianensis TaxID=2763676 RepID=A0A926IRV0_9FIRM|nr:23S rRNA (pseudouridine(1915)-N(3))-methyltransferase RlmH [Qingrenia yutianensis]MBC8595321.1 23S rRNA (pseudouridine(1915)-N(3))-methyltransferase RlmH [Qingrenia yutianensis]